MTRDVSAVSDPQTLVSDPKTLADGLEASGALFVRQFEGFDPAAVRWKPEPTKWSALEVLVHMWDEERLDFRPRLQSALDDPKRPWLAIDPEGWPVERSYNTQDPAAALADFRDERARSLDWLRGLDDPPWGNTYEHPELGPLRAGDLMVSWLAHDHLHVRQLANLQILLHARGTYSTYYAMP